ncbi:GntR family transcriptional regulator [Amycolatopsis sp. CA-126428]|uniref:GntR family transcriptional regulator n=1 Tax=Amycolatopsis sp. CA-126428 TaxID=2073158 RepID=UPI000CD0A76B|nr:GntR family transcriptional regulator [Amycolatopsis sp. CA-126428]
MPSDAAPAFDARRKPAKGGDLSDLLPKQMPASRSDAVLEALRRAILGGILKPGQPLVERELAESLGVSKTPVREALKQVGTTGLVEVVSFQGVRVRELDADFVEKLYTARLITEPAAVRLGVQRTGATTLIAARAALAEAAGFAAAGDVSGLGIANRNFHRVVYSTCENSFLCDFLDRLQDLTAFAATTGWRLQATYEQEAGEHQGILDAVEAGDADVAERRSREHVESASRTLAEALRDQLGH